VVKVAAALISQPLRSACSDRAMVGLGETCLRCDRVALTSVGCDGARRCMSLHILTGWVRWFD